MLKNEVKLSICIPTFNRNDLILELIRSICASIEKYMLHKYVEICISDNASTDDTTFNIERLISNKVYNITYNKLDTNIGPDLNYIECTKKATGDYIWLMGSDDTINVDSISILLNKLEEYNLPELCIFNRVNCDFKMNPINVKKWLCFEDDMLFNFKNPSELKEYIKKSKSLGALFSYLSSIVVKRKSWIELAPDMTLNGSAYIHVDILSRIILSGANLIYLDKELVNCRGDNDTFSGKELLDRVVIDYKYYSDEKFLSLFSIEYKDLLLNVLRNEWSFKEIFIRYNLSKNNQKKIFYKKIAYNYGQLRCFLCLNIFFSLLMKGLKFGKTSLKKLR
jgi:abequosyltransferase